MSKQPERESVLGGESEEVVRVFYTQEEMQFYSGQFSATYVLSFFVSFHALI